MAESNTIYVDSEFYRTKMKESLEDTDCSSYPVQIFALRIDWILKAQDKVEGYEFL